MGADKADPLFLNAGMQARRARGIGHIGPIADARRHWPHHDGGCERGHQPDDIRVLRCAIKRGMGNARATQRVRGKVEAAIGIEPEATARARLRKGPDAQRLAGKRLRDLHGHRRIRKGDLQKKDRRDGVRIDIPDHRACRVSIKQQGAWTNGRHARRIKASEGACRHLLGIGHIESRAPQWQDQPWLCHLSLRSRDRHAGNSHRRRPAPHRPSLSTMGRQVNPSGY